MEMPRQNKAMLSRREKKLRERTSSQCRHHAFIFNTDQTGTLLCNTALLLCNTALLLYNVALLLFFGLIMFCCCYCTSLHLWATVVTQ